MSFDTQGALKAGWKMDDIRKYLAGHPRTTQPQAPKPQGLIANLIEPFFGTAKAMGGVGFEAYSEGK